MLLVTLPCLWLLSLWLIVGIEILFARHDGIGQMQQFACGGAASNLHRFACGPQALIEGFNHGIVLSGAERRKVQDRAQTAVAGVADAGASMHTGA